MLKDSQISYHFQIDHKFKNLTVIFLTYGLHILSPINPRFFTIILILNVAIRKLRELVVVLQEEDRVDRQDDADDARGDHE